MSDYKVFYNVDAETGRCRVDRSWDFPPHSRFDDV